MLILDEGAWTAYACLTRSGVWLVASSLLLTAAGYLCVLLMALELWGKQRFKPDPTLPNERRAKPVALAMGFLVILGVSAFEATKRDRDILYIDGSKMVEKGCFLAMPFENTFEIKHLVVTFKPNLFKSRATPGIVIRTGEMERLIGVPLENSRHLKNIFAAFPIAMRMYVDTFRDNVSLSTDQRKALEIEKTLP